MLDLGDSAYFLAEGIFAQEIVGECRRRGLLADAVCVTQHPAVTFVRRLTRDLREHRKPPFVLVRRGCTCSWHSEPWWPPRRSSAAGDLPGAAYREIRALTRRPGSRGLRAVSAARRTPA